MSAPAQRRDGASSGFSAAPLRSSRRAGGAAVAAVACAGVAAAAVAGATVATAALTAAPSEPVARVQVERQLMLMGTWATVAVAAADAPRASAAAAAAVRALEATEARLSTWRDDSELAQLNTTPAGVAATLSPELAAELAAARACSELTAGAFDPGVGGLVALWGLRSGGRLPSAAEIAATLPGSRAAALRLDGAVATRLHPALALDEGGFGKGAGLDRALAAAQAAGAAGAWLDLGGQVAQLGADPWAVAVAYPDDRERPAVELTLAGGSLSTSGNGERRLVVDGRRVGHLLDPRTGAPAADFGSLTVWAESGLLADCLSTGLFVLGPEAALAWAAEHPEVGVLALERRPGGGLRARTSARLAGRVRAVAPGVELVPPSPRPARAAAASPQKERSSGPAR